MRTAVRHPKRERIRTDLWKCAHTGTLLSPASRQFRNLDQVGDLAAWEERRGRLRPTFLHRVLLGVLAAR
jgi:hypothetical protein